MEMEHPVYVPSKGRAATITTVKLLEEDGIDHLIVVEPGQDQEEYANRFGEGRLLVLTAPGRGIAFVRNCCKEHAERLGAKWHWMLDDDIRSFMLREPGNRSKTAGAKDVMAVISRYALSHDNVVRAGTNQNSWPPGKEPFKINYPPEQCTFNKVGLDAKFRLATHVDFDFTLQLLRMGHCVVTFDWLRTNCPRIGSNAGGLQPAYQDQAGILREMQSLVSEFGTMTIDQDDKGWHLRRNGIWRTFPQRPHRKATA